MTFMESVQTCIAKIVTINGRARRSEYWYFALFVFLMSFALNMILGRDNGIAHVITIALNLASFTVTIRRLHDIGKSGWWILIGFVPVIGWIVLLVWGIRDSQPGDNRFGPNPKNVYGGGIY